MKLKFINYPSYIPRESYNKLINKIAGQLMHYEEVVSVYQMGSIKDPGISDLDMICVFKNQSQCTVNIRKELNSAEKEILTHGCFGINENMIAQSLKYNLLTNLSRLDGKELKLFKIGSPEIATNIKSQIAGEFLLKMFITLDIQITYGIIKLRSFLLLAKAIMFDLELLGIKTGKLFDLVSLIINLRKNWFTNVPSELELQEIISEFQQFLHEFLNEEFSKQYFCLPAPSIDVTKNAKINQGKFFTKKHQGLSLPNKFKFLGKKYINLQNRFNRYYYYVPFKLPESNSSLEERFAFSKKLVEINRKNYPFFIPLTTSLNMF